MSKEAVFTPNAPRPVASYSQAVRKANILVMPGQGGFDATTDKLVGPEVEEQTRRTLRNLRLVAGRTDPGPASGPR